VTTPSKLFPAHPAIKMCPKCFDSPFVPFMYGQVRCFSWFGLRRQTVSVICWHCKEIIAHDDYRKACP